MSKTSDTLDRRTVGQLHLKGTETFGCGGHSYVYLASLTLPSCVGPTWSEVAVKVPTTCESAKRMLVHEAKIYDNFPCELQESTPSSPPVVPRFYGYYESSCESLDNYEVDNGNEEVTRKVRSLVQFIKSFINPMLLLEPCGTEVEVEKLSTSNK
jgi:hypothetical protein